MTAPATARLLTGADLRALSQRSDLRGTLQITRHVLLIIGAGWLVAIASPLWLLPAMLLLGILQSSLFAPIHETMHLTAFRSRRANAVVGWLAAAPSLLNWHFYAAFHLAHHRFTQDPLRDPELTPPAPTGMQSYLLRILGINYWRARLQVLADVWRGDLSAYPYIPTTSQVRIIRSVRAMCVFVTVLAAISVYFVGWWAPLVFWIVPQLLGQIFLRFYLLTEHTGCTEDSNGLTNTRTTLTNGIMRVLMWNMGYHAEHHLYPSIPFHRLADAHIALRDQLTVVQPGYARWHLAYLKGLLRPT